MSDSEADDYNLRLTLSPPGRSSWSSSPSKGASNSLFAAVGESGGNGGVPIGLFATEHLRQSDRDAVGNDNEYADKGGNTFLPSGSAYVSHDHGLQKGYGNADCASASFDLGQGGSLVLAPCGGGENLLDMNLCSGTTYWAGYGNVKEGGRQQQSEEGGGAGATRTNAGKQYSGNYEASYTATTEQGRSSTSNEGGGGAASRRGGRTGDHQNYAGANTSNRGGGQNYKNNNSGKEMDRFVEEGGSAGNSNSNNSSNNTAAAMVMMMMGHHQKGGGGGGGKEERIGAPYPWAAERRAGVLSLEELRAKGIGRVWGEVVCRKCDGGGGGGGAAAGGGGGDGNGRRMEVEIWEQFARVRDFFLANRARMHDRAPPAWYSPRLLDCPQCLHADCLRPVVAPKKREINWLFLLLTQTLGLCTLEQLKYFCKHNRKHRTGAKDRVLYLTYASLLKQLDPSAPYHL